MRLRCQGKSVAGRWAIGPRSSPQPLVRWRAGLALLLGLFAVDLLAASGPLSRREAGATSAAPRSSQSSVETTREWPERIDARVQEIQVAGRQWLQVDLDLGDLELAGSLLGTAVLDCSCPGACRILLRIGTDKSDRVGLAVASLDREGLELEVADLASLSSLLGGQEELLYELSFGGALGADEARELGHDVAERHGAPGGATLRQLGGLPTNTQQLLARSSSTVASGCSRHLLALTDSAVFVATVRQESKESLAETSGRSLAWVQEWGAPIAGSWLRWRAGSSILPSGLTLVAGDGPDVWVLEWSPQTGVGLRGAFSSSVQAEPAGGGVLLRSSPFELLEDETGNLDVLLGPERFGGDRLRTSRRRLDRPGPPEATNPPAGPAVVEWSLLAPAAEEKECWSRLPNAERLMDSRFLSRGGRAVLLAVTREADRVGILERKKLRLFELEGDRTRVGRLPVYERVTASRLWQRLDHHLVDVSGDGIDDLVLLQPEGLSGHKLVIDVFDGRGGLRFPDKPRRVVLKESGRWRYGRDFTSDRVPDLLIAREAGVGFFVGAGGLDKSPFRDEPVAVLSWPGPVGGAAAAVGGDDEPRFEVIIDRGSGRTAIVASRLSGGRVLLRFWLPS